MANYAYLKLNHEYVITYSFNHQRKLTIKKLYPVAIKYAAKNLNCLIEENVKKVNGKSQRFIKISKI